MIREKDISDVVIFFKGSYTEPDFNEQRRKVGLLRYICVLEWKNALSC